MNDATSHRDALSRAECALWAKPIFRRGGAHTIFDREQGYFQNISLVHTTSWRRGIVKTTCDGLRHSAYSLCNLVAVYVFCQQSQNTKGCNSHCTDLVDEPVWCPAAFRFLLLDMMCGGWTKGWVAACKFHSMSSAVPKRSLSTYIRLTNNHIRNSGSSFCRQSKK